jgi:drug/metabolite transporter (DMT)-like permease
MVVVGGKADGATADASVIGNLLLFGTVLTWSIYTILAKRLADTDFVAVIAAVSVAGTLMLIPAALAEAATSPATPIARDGWLRIAYLGAFSSGSAICFTTAPCATSTLARSVPSAIWRPLSAS